MDSLLASRPTGGTLELDGLSAPYMLSGEDQEPDFGGPQPLTEVIQSLLLDGSIVRGDRDDNRVVVLPVWVLTSDGTRPAQKVSDLLDVINQQSWTLTWTPTGGLPMVFECLRGAATVEWNAHAQRAGVARVVCTIPAKPFIRSPDREFVTLGGIPELSIKSFDSGPGVAGWTLASTPAQPVYQGVGSALWTVTRTATLTTTIQGKVQLFPTISPPTLPVTPPQADLSIYAAIQFAYRYEQIGGYGNHLLTLTLTVTDGSGNSGSQVFQTSTSAAKWYLATFPVAGFGPAIDWTNIASMSIASQFLQLFRRTSTSATETIRLYIDDLRAIPPSSGRISVTNGGVYTVPGVVGTARTPVAAGASLVGGGALHTLLLHSVRRGDQGDLTPIVHVGQANGSPYTVTLGDCNFDGTYSVVVCVLWAVASGTRTLSVTVAQQLAGVTKVSTTVSRTVDKATYPDGIVPIDAITLPMWPVAVENTQTGYVFTITDTQNGDTINDVLFLDTRGSTAILRPGAATSYRGIYIDEPDPSVEMGQVYGDQANPSDRSQAISLLPVATLSGGPFSIVPGDNDVVIYSNDGAPSINMAFYPRWRGERLS